MAVLLAIAFAATSAAGASEPGADDVRVQWILHSSTVAQTLTDSRSDPASLLTTYYQIEGNWAVSSRWTLHGEAEGGQVVDDDEDLSLAASLGSAYKLNDMQEGTAFQVATFYFSGSTPSANVKWKFGKVGQDEFFDDNRVARSKRRKFLALPFTKNPGVPFAGKGLGGALTWSPDPHVAFTVSASDANARGTLSGFSTWRGEWFNGMELTLRPYESVQTAAIRLLAWRTERGGVEDNGAAISADHEITPNVVAFIRLAEGSRHFARVGRFAGGGLAWEAPFNRKQDFLGIGISRGDPILAGRRTEYLSELVYRWQATTHLAVSPDIQYIRHPAASNVNHAFAFAIRLALSN